MADRREFALESMRQPAQCGAQRATGPRPWLIRTYSGHSSASGLERALPQEPGARSDRSVGRLRPADPDRLRRDHELARGRGRQGRRAGLHLGDMRTLFEGIPLERMNTSMTINATAPWLLALYIAWPSSRGWPARQALGHDPERHHQGVPLARHLHLPAGALDEADRPTSSPSPTARCRSGTRPTSAPITCRRPGATPVQELAFALATAIAVLDAVKATAARCRTRTSRRWSGRISFFVNAGIRFITEMCKMRAFTELWDEICGSATASRTPSTAASATACRSIPWA